MDYCLYRRVHRRIFHHRQTGAGAGVRRRIKRPDFTDFPRSDSDCRLQNQNCRRLQTPAVAHRFRRDCGRFDGSTQRHHHQQIYRRLVRLNLVAQMFDFVYYPKFAA